MTARIIAISNQKGGVGKTTTAVNLASGLALEGVSTLLIDLDPQANATSGLGFDPRQRRRSVYHALIGMARVEDIKLKSPDVENLSLLPASPDLLGAEIELVDSVAREYRLKEALQADSSLEQFVVIDCPPSLGLLTVNALAASSSALIPLQCEYYALEGISQLMRTINLMQRNINPALELEGVLLTMFDKRNNLSHQVAEDARGHFGNRIFDTVIPRNVRLSESPSHGKSIHHYDKASRGARAYRQLAQELVRRHHSPEKGKPAR